MATIDDLNRSISQMTTEELNARILELRKSRRISKAAPKTVSKASGKSPDLASLMSMLSKEELAELLKTLED
jgi:ribosomal protein L7/L12